MPRRPTIQKSEIAPLHGETTYVDRAGVRWRLDMEYLPIDGRLAPVGMTIRSYEEQQRGGLDLLCSLNDHWQTISTANVRAWAPATMDELARSHLNRIWLDRIATDFPESSYVKAIASAAREPGRVRHSEDHWRVVAEVYRRAYATGDFPAREVAREFGVKPSTARSWVRRCRELDLLPATDERRSRA